jgi:hypothetical protein
MRAANVTNLHRSATMLWFRENVRAPGVIMVPIITIIMVNIITIMMVNIITIMMVNIITIMMVNIITIIMVNIITIIMINIITIMRSQLPSAINGFQNWNEQSGWQYSDLEK